MSDLLWIIGMIVTVGLMLGGLQLACWRSVEAAIRRNTAEILALRTILADGLASIRAEAAGRHAESRTSPVSAGSLSTYGQR